MLGIFLPAYVTGFDSLPHVCFIITRSSLRRTGQRSDEPTGTSNRGAQFNFRFASDTTFCLFWHRRPRLRLYRLLQAISGYFSLLQAILT